MKRVKTQSTSRDLEIIQDLVSNHNDEEGTGDDNRDDDVMLTELRRKQINIKLNDVSMSTVSAVEGQTDVNSVQIAQTSLSLTIPKTVIETSHRFICHLQT